MLTGDTSSTSLIQRTISIARSEGINAVWQRACGRLFRKPELRRLLVMSLSLTDNLPVVEPKIPLEFAELTPMDFDELIALQPYLTEEVIRLRLETGHRCYITKSEGRITSTRWLAVNKVYIPYLGLPLPLAPDEFYGAEAYVVPEYRGNRIHQAFITFASKEMYEQGYRRATTFVHPRSRPAMQSVINVGFRKRGHVGFVELLGIRRYFYRATEALSLLHNSFLVPRRQLAPDDLEGQIW